MIVGGVGNDNFESYFLDSNINIRGRQTFRYVGNDGTDVIIGFDPLLDTILVPVGSQFEIADQSNDDTVIDFVGNDAITLIDCACSNTVRVIRTNDIDFETTDISNDKEDLTGTIVSAVTVPIVLLAAILFVYRRFRNNEGIGLCPRTQERPVDSEGSKKTSHWFSLIYGRSKRMEDLVNSVETIGSIPSSWTPSEESGERNESIIAEQGRAVSEVEKMQGKGGNMNREQRWSI